MTKIKASIIKNNPNWGMSRCYGLPFFKNIALGGLCKTYNLL